jgi:hydrogenase maturation factor HypF (carbamoyltransferase family)
LRIRINVTGIVQGVGFRPFVYRLAVRNRLAGYVRNRGDAGVEIFLEGEMQGIKTFIKDLTKQKPPLAQIDHVKSTELYGKNQYKTSPFTKAPKKLKPQAQLSPRISLSVINA